MLFLQNDELEESFKKCFTNLTLKSLRSKNDKPCIQSQQQQSSPLAPRVTLTRDVNRLEALQGISGPLISQTSVTEWRQWILRHLDEYVLRISGNEGINLIAGMNHST